MTEGWHRRWGWTVAHYIRNGTALCGRQKYTGEPNGTRRGDRECASCLRALKREGEARS